MLFSNALYESLIERICCVQVINQFLIILHRMLVLALAHRKLRECGTIAQYQLRTEVFNKRCIRFAATLHTVRLVDDQHGLGVSNSVHRAMELAQHLVIVLTGEQLTVGNELRIEQQHINLMLGMMRTVKEMTYGRRHVQTPLLLLLLRFQQTQLYFCIIVAHRLKVSFHLLLLQECSSSCLNRQCRYGNDELVESATLVQFEHGSGIDVCLARTRLHLDIENTMIRQVLDFIREHIMSHPLPGGFIRYLSFQTHQA